MVAQSLRRDGNHCVLASAPINPDGVELTLGHVIPSSVHGKVSELSTCSSSTDLA
jgi:hypothetical protein